MPLQTITFNGKIGVYKITNPNGAVYIGSTRNLQKRIRHYTSFSCKGQRKIYESMVKFGPKNHSFEIIQELPFDISKTDLLNQESAYIGIYFSSGLEMMNIDFSNDANTKVSKETKNKISVSLKGFKRSEETKRKISAASSLRRHTDASKLILSQKLTGNKNAAGIVFTQERKDKISAAQKGIKKPHLSGENNVSKRPDVREKISKSKFLYWVNKKKDNANRIN